MSRPIGALMYRMMGRRRAIAERNIRRCFPELDSDEVQSLVRQNFRSLGRTVFEVAWCWGASEKRMQRILAVEGKQHLLRAAAMGKGLLVVTAHMTCLEIGGRSLGGLVSPAAAIYRPLNNQVLEWYQNRARLSYADALISKRDIRSAIRFLRQGGGIWYAPDQDFGTQQSVFVPFFGIQTATLEATHKLAKTTGCLVMLMFPRFEPGNRRYVTTVFPPIPDFPGDDAAADLQLLNSLMEKHIRKVPDQYWWIHRRFKSRPAGEAPFYD